MKELSKSNKLKALIATKMTDLIKFLDYNGKYAVYTGWNIRGLYRYLEMLGAPTTLTTSVHLSRRYGPSPSTNNDTASLQSVLLDLHMIQISICKFFGIIGHKDDVCIIRGPKFLPPSLRININQFNVLHCEEPNEPPRYCNSQPPADNLKYSTSPPKTILVVSAVMGRLNHCAIDYGDVDFRLS